jgi:hypothetical protein
MLPRTLLTADIEHNSSLAIAAPTQRCSQGCRTWCKPGYVFVDQQSLPHVWPHASTWARVNASDFIVQACPLSWTQAEALITLAM